MLAYKTKKEMLGTWDTLPKGSKEIIHEAILEAAQNRNGPEGYIYDKEAIEEIEYNSRDGFIASSYNNGGLIYRDFTDLMGYYGGGYSVAHSGANAEIERQIKLAFEQVSEIMVERLGTEFEYYFGSKIEKVSYANFVDLRDTSEKQGRPTSKLDAWISEIQEIENECLSGENSSIMHELRFMYHGKVDGVHSASISAAVNTEGPYHRSHISWAPNVFCEGSKEVEITWKNQAELKTKIKKAFAKVSKAVF